jgi:transposase
MEITTIGIDLAKNVLALCAADGRGRVVLRQELRRTQVLKFFTGLKPCTVGMEACGGAHYWARQLNALGHAVRLVSPALVAPYRKSHKNDRADAEAICEAVSRPTMRFVAVKSVAQQDLVALHRIRAQLLKQLLALANQIRGLLRERGLVVGAGMARLKRALAAGLPDQAGSELSEELRQLLLGMGSWLRQLEQRIGDLERRIAQGAKHDERCKRLMEVPGVGLLTATALVATVGNAREFKSGRQLSAFLGLTPRQHSSGGKTVLLGISKRGDRYLRTLLIHGARSALRGKKFAAEPRGRWAARIAAARGPNVAAVALANHNARIAAALLRNGQRYQSQDALS